MGYIVAGGMLEHLTQTSFEDLLQQEYFAPLGMTTGGFGAAGTTGQIDEPWSHAPEPFEPYPEADNPIIFSPAGRAHMSILDFARHAVFHLTGKPELVSPGTLELIHTPVMDDYALGWGKGERSWAGGIGLSHAGSNGRSFALVGIALPKNKALLCATNQGDETGSSACIALFQELTKRYLQ